LNTLYISLGELETGIENMERETLQVENVNENSLKRKM
jgi:hypothetical protein